MLAIADRNAEHGCSMNSTSGAAEAYQGLSVNARLVVALETTERLCETLSLSDPTLDELIEHLWGWLVVDASGFNEWHDFENPILDAALGDPVPEEFRATAVAARLDEPQARRWITGLVEIVYGHLFGAIDHAATQQWLADVLEVASDNGIRPNDPANYEMFGSRQDGDGWGTKVRLDEVTAW